MSNDWDLEKLHLTLHKLYPPSRHPAHPFSEPYRSTPTKLHYTSAKVHYHSDKLGLVYHPDIFILESWPFTPDPSPFSPLTLIVTNLHMPLFKKRSYPFKTPFTPLSYSSPHLCSSFYSRLYTLSCSKCNSFLLLHICPRNVSSPFSSTRHQSTLVFLLKLTFCIFPTMRFSTPFLFFPSVIIASFPPLFSTVELIVYFVFHFLPIPSFATIFPISYPGRQMSKNEYK